MQKTVLISFPVEDLQAIIIDCVNVCLKNNLQAKPEQLTTLFDTLPDRLQTRDIKKLFNISSVTVWQWKKKGLLVSQVINGRNYYAKSDVLKLLGKKSKNNTL